MPISQSNNHHNLKQERIAPLLLPTFSHLFNLSAKSLTCDYLDTDLHRILTDFSFKYPTYACQVLNIPYQKKKNICLKNGEHYTT
jgi:hypothetical protein